MRRCLRLFLLVLSVCALAACGDREPVRAHAARTGPPVLACVSYPLAYFASRLCGDAAEVRFDTPAGQDPAYWNPSDQEVRRFQTADLILANGAGYAHWMRLATLPSGRIVDTSRAFHERFIEGTSGVTHAHGPGGEHTHEALAFTTWLDFGQAAAQAQAIADALAARGLVPPERLKSAASDLARDLGALHERMQKLGVRWGRRPLLVSHPVYQYLARAYGLNIKSEHFEPGVHPSEEALLILGSLLKIYPATKILWEAQPLPETAEALTRLGLESVVFDPCANRPAAGDFLSVMQANVARLEAALTPP